MNDHLSKRAQLLAEILRYINDGNYERAGEAWSFGVGHGSSRAQAHQNEAVFQKMRRLVYDHVARTVAIERTSLSGPPAIDSLAPEFKKLMDELTPETREALGQAFVPIAAGQESQVPERYLQPRANWTRSIATTRKKFSTSWTELFPGPRR
jgi:hypothetical protein